MRHVLRHRLAALLVALSVTFGGLSAYWAMNAPAVITVADPGEGHGGG
jgi:hypothetical protein